MDVRVPREPPLVVHVGPPADPELELALAGCDVNDLSDRFVLVPAGDVDDDAAAREPSLAGAVDVRVGGATEAEIAPDVDMPGPEVRVHVVVVAVRLIGHPLGRPEVDATRHGPARVVVEHGHMHPVPPLLEDLDPHAVVLGRTRVQPRPRDPPELATVIPHRDRRRRHRGDPCVGARALGIVVVAPTTAGVGQVRAEIVLREPVGVAGDAAIDLNRGLDQRSWMPSIDGRDPDRAGGLTREGIFAGIRRRDRRHDDPPIARDQLDRADRYVRTWVLPHPPEVVGPVRPHRLALPHADVFPTPHVAVGQDELACPRRGERRLRIPPVLRHEADLDAFPDRDRLARAVLEVDDVLREHLPGSRIGR